MLKSSCGMVESDIVVIFGKPDMIIYRKDYDNLLKQFGAEKKTGLRMPVINKVYVYDMHLPPIGDFYYVFIDNNNIVYCTYLASGDFYPFYQKSTIRNYRIHNNEIEK